MIDKTVLSQQLGGDDQFLAEVIKDFRKQRRQLSLDIRQALDRDDLTRVSEYAHKLKGSLLTLGARPAADAAFRVEALGLKGDLETRDAVLLLERELELLEPELEKLARHGFGSH